MRRFFILLLCAFCISLTSTWMGQPALAQQELSVATIERKPFAFKENDVWTGFSIELWQAIAENLGVTTRFIETETFPELLGQVEKFYADAAIANISITYQREESMDFSLPIFDSGLMVLAPAGGSASIFDVILNRELFMWLGGAAVLLFGAANLIYLFERHRHPQFGRSYWSGLGEGIWWTFNAIMNAGFEIATPSSRSGRVLAFGLIILGLFVVSAFVAQITAALTVGQLTSQVGGYQDLYDKRVGTTSGSTSASFLTEKSIRFKAFDDISEVFAALEAGDIDAMVHDAPILSYYAATEGRGRFTTAGRVFHPEKYGIALPSVSSRREDVNRAILRIREDGTYEALIEKWFGGDYQ